MNHFHYVLELYRMYGLKREILNLIKANPPFSGRDLSRALFDTERTNPRRTWWINHPKLRECTFVFLPDQPKAACQVLAAGQMKRWDKASSSYPNQPNLSTSGGFKLAVRNPNATRQWSAKAHEKPKKITEADSTRSTWFKVIFDTPKNPNGIDLSSLRSSRHRRSRPLKRIAMRSLEERIGLRLKIEDEI